MSWPVPALHVEPYYRSVVVSVVVEQSCSVSQSSGSVELVKLPEVELAVRVLLQDVAVEMGE